MIALVRLAMLAPPFALFGLALHALLQTLPNVPTDTLAYGTPGVLMLGVWAFMQELITTGKAVKRERVRGDRLEKALLSVATKAMSATEALASVTTTPATVDE